MLSYKTRNNHNNNNKKKKQLFQKTLKFIQYFKIKVSNIHMVVYLCQDEY